MNDNNFMMDSLDAKPFTFAIEQTPLRQRVEMQPSEVAEEPDFISGIDSRGNIIGGKKKKVKAPLVIPMPPGWSSQYKNYEYKKLAEKIKNGEPIENEEETPIANSVSVPASDEPMQTEPDLNNNNNMDVVIDDAAYEYIMSLPPILRNRPPGLDKILDEKDRFLYDVQSRPNEADLDAYNRMPLEEYGIAMLRGMGWTEGMPIGKNAQHVVPVIQFIRQPPRVGLGAVVRVQEVKKPEGWILKPGESRDPPPVMALPKDSDGRVRHWKTIDEQLKPIKEPFSTGSRLFITGGVHQGITGKTVMKQGDKVVVLLPSDERVVVHTKDLKELEDNEPIPSLPVTNDTTTSGSKITTINTSTHTTITITDNPIPAAPAPASSSTRKHKKHKSKDKHKKKKDSKKKHKKRKRSYSDSSESSSTTTTTSKPPSLTEPPVVKEFRWITPDIRVKICSKSISEGRYYCKLAWIIDILPENRCVLRLEDSGVLIENIRQSDLETVIPAQGGPVKVVRGDYCGELGTVYEKMPSRNEVYVQLEDNLEICKMSYDDVAQIRE